MPGILQLLCRLLLLAVLFGQVNAQTASHPLVFSRVTVIDATGVPAKPNMTVVLEPFVSTRDNCKKML